MKAIDFKIHNAIQFAKILRICPEWNQFKNKWDGILPERGSAEFEDYKHDAFQTREAIQKLCDDFNSEWKIKIAKRMGCKSIFYFNELDSEHQQEAIKIISRISGKDAKHDYIYGFDKKNRFTQIPVNQFFILDNQS